MRSELLFLSEDPQTEPRTDFTVADKGNAAANTEPCFPPDNLRATPHHAPIDFSLPEGAPASGYGPKRRRTSAEMMGFDALGLGDRGDIGFRCL